MILRLLQPVLASRTAGESRNPAVENRFRARIDRAHRQHGKQRRPPDGDHARVARWIVHNARLEQ